jgi:predicted nuclease with TOPRIM domain
MTPEQIAIQDLVETCGELITGLSKLSLAVDFLLSRVTSLEKDQSLLEETIQSLNEEMTDLEEQVIEIDDRLDTLEQIEEASE